MDPVTAFGLAAGILQVIDMSTKALTVCRELYKDGSLAEHRDTEAITHDLAKTVDQLKASMNQTTTSNSPIDKDISDISYKCSTTAAELLAELDKLKVRKGDGKRKIIKSSLRAIRGKTVVKEIQDKLDKYKRLLDTRILIRLDAHSLQQRDDFSSLNREVQNITFTLNQGHKTVAQLLPTLETQHQALSNHIDRKFEDHARLESERAAQQCFKESLFFPEILARQEQIKEAHQGTCQWIFQFLQDEIVYDIDDQIELVKEQPWSDFNEWLHNDQELYWISGKAGSGKSTLMEYLRGEQSQIEASLAHWARDTRLVTVFFYFWNPGTEIQKSFRGLLRSLLYQIIDQQHDLIPLMMGQPQGSDKVSSGPSNSSQLHEWTERRLLGHLERFLKHKPPSLSLCFFIDGLDEFVGDQDTLLETVRMLSGTPQVKVCVSSRPEQIFRLEFRHSPQLRLPDFNRRDIQKTTDDRLKPVLLQKFPDQEEDVLRFISAMSDKAQGVFLWLDLVIRDVVEGARNDDTLLELEKRLDITPDSIDGLFKHMLGKLNKSYQEEAGHYFRVLASAAFNGLSCNLLSFACMENQSRKHSLQNDKTYFTSNSFLQLCDTLETRILTRCAGLVEIEEPQYGGSRIFYGICPLDKSSVLNKEISIGKSSLSSHWRVVSFIHRSASDFVYQHYAEFFKPANWYSIGNLEYARGRICTIALLPMLLAPEHLQQSIPVNGKIIVNIDRHMSDIAFSLHTADEHSHSGPTDLGITEDLIQTTEYLYNILCHVEEELKTLIIPMDAYWNFSFLPYKYQYVPFNDAVGLASYFGLQSAVLPQLSSENHDPEYLNYLLVCTAAGTPKRGRVKRSCSTYIEIVEALLDLGADPNLKVCTQNYIYGNILKTEQSVWAEFLKVAFNNDQFLKNGSRLRILLPRLFRGLCRNTSVLSIYYSEVESNLASDDYILVVLEESSISYLNRIRALHDVQGWEELDHFARSFCSFERTRVRLVSVPFGAFYELDEIQSERLSAGWNKRIDGTVVEAIFSEPTEANKIDPETFVLQQTF